MAHVGTFSAFYVGEKITQKKGGQVQHPILKPVDSVAAFMMLIPATTLW
jgi:hypothetical protein